MENKRKQSFSGEKRTYEEKQVRVKRPRIGATNVENKSFDRPKRSYGDREERPYGERKSFGDRPRRSFGESERRSFDRPRRPYGDREERPYGERKSFGDRPRRSFGESESRTFDRPRRPYGDREERPYGERKAFGDRPRRSFGDSESRTFDRPRRPYGDREERPYGERKSFGDRPRRSFGDSESRTFDRPRRKYGESEGRSFDRPRRSFGDKSFGERKFSRRPAGDRNFSHFRDEEESGIGKMINRRPRVEDSYLSDNDLVKPTIKEEVRLNKFIANSGICSRREADNFIQAGVVTVNGEVVTELGSKVNIYNDDVRFNGERLKGEEKVYIVMNKPKDFVTTVSDPHAEKTVMDLLKGCKSRVFPVGRLDKNTTGVLMFTNDGEIAEKLTHPSYDKKKIYQVSLDSNLKQEDYDQIKEGIELPDGIIKADALEYIEEDDHRKIGIEIHSGKNRVVRRIFESLGYEVKALDRVYFAGLTKTGLKRGEWRVLTTGETNLLKMGAYN